MKHVTCPYSSTIWIVDFNEKTNLAYKGDKHPLWKEITHLITHDRPLSVTAWAHDQTIRICNEIIALLANPLVTLMEKKRDEKALALHQLKLTAMSLLVALDQENSDQNQKNAAVDFVTDVIYPLADDLQEPQTPVPTYQELIFWPQEATTFFVGEEGQGEYHFYKGHLMIEKQYEVALDAVNWLLQEKSSVDDFFAAMTTIEENLKNATRSMARYRSAYDKDLFARLRPYFSIPESFQEQLPINDGPSGASSSVIPLLTLKINGHMLQDTQEQEWNYFKSILAQNEKNFATNAIGELQQVMSELHTGTFVSLVDYAESIGSVSLLEAAKKINTLCIRFKKAHYAVVKHHLPVVEQKDALWTGGFPMKSTLQNAIHMLEKANTIIDQKISNIKK